MTGAHLAATALIMGVPLALFVLVLWYERQQATYLRTTPELVELPAPPGVPERGISAQVPRLVSHREPSRPLSVAEAHLTMQVHVTCRADSCPGKQAALRALVAAGRLVPDRRAERHLDHS